jgi:hypothetical protein
VRFIVGFTFAAAVAASGAACMSGNSGNGLVPIVGTPPQKTEVFSGTVGVGSAMYFAFAVANVGDLTVTLSAASPPDAVVMRIGLGIGDTTTCQIQITQDTPAGTTPQINATQVPAGTYCIGIGDIGNATGPVTFSFTVVHT